MYVLECGHYSEIIAWNPEGKSFTILKTNEFEERVLPEIFKEAKFSSFQRKVSPIVSVRFLHVAFNGIPSFEFRVILAYEEKTLFITF